MPRAQSSQPTQFEGLARIQPPKTAVNPQSQYSYNEARAGYVERPHGDYAAFARLIRGFGDEANKALNNYADRMIDEQVAKGREIFAENPDLEKNKRNWKDYVEEHPDDISRFWSPFIQRGYEEARLKCLSMDQKKAMDEAFMQSDMVNETDPQKVADWIQKFNQDWRKDNMLDKYEDKLMLARNFSPLEFANRQELLQRHTQIVVAQREQKLAEMQTQLALSEADVAFKGRRMMDGDAGVFANIIMKNAEVARANGMLDKNMPEMMANAVFTYYEQNNRNPSILKALDQIVTPNGAKLSSLPGVQKKINDAAEQRLARARADWAHSVQVENYNNKKLKEHYEGTYLLEKAKNGEAITVESLRADKVPDKFIPSLLAAGNTLYKAQKTMNLDAPANQGALVAAYLKAKNGDMTSQEAIEMAETIGSDEAIKLAEASQKAQDEEGKKLTTYFKEAMSMGKALFAGRDDLFNFDVTQISSAGMAGFGGDDKVMRQLQAANLAQAKVEAYYADQKTRNKGVPPTEYEMRKMYPKLLMETYEEIRSDPRLNKPATAAPVVTQQTAPNTATPTSMQGWFAQNMPGVNFADFGGNLMKMGTAVNNSRNPALIANFNAFIRGMGNPK